MILYKIYVSLRDGLEPDTIAKLMTKHSAGRAKKEEGSRFYVTEADPMELVFCQIAELKADPENTMREYLDKLGITYTKIRRNQICIAELASAVAQGSQEDLCPEIPEILGPLSMMPYVCEPFSDGILEATFQGKVTRAGAKRECAAFHSHALAEEAERIWAGEGQPFRGHPVLYSIVTATQERNEEFMDFLLPLLHKTGRLLANRVCKLTPCRKPLPQFVLEDLYIAQGGATIVVDLTGEEAQAEAAESLQAISRLARQHRSTVLTVFRACAEDKKALQMLAALTDDLPVLTLTEDKLTAAEAKRFLRKQAKAADLDSVSLIARLPKTQAAFSEQELETLFEAWHDSVLCTELYPQYAELSRRNTAVSQTAPAPSAMRELQQLIGLTEVKALIKQVVDYAAMQKLCRERGIPSEPPHLHMAFTGNPGTAKTTVARLVARIFREEGVLSKGELVEVGRGDLIGKYVGWTANLVREKFREAEGSVLFIDEAYSLLDDRENQFGDEAINAIVQEMENHRDNTVVIFAGYQEPMQKFLDRNPGLRSRVSYQVDFPDYTENELMEIFRLQLKAKARTLDAAAEKTVRAALRNGMQNGNFGNGRFARKLAEQAMLAQASRLAALPPERISTEALLCLTEADFSRCCLELPAPSQPRVIGFCA